MNARDFEPAQSADDLHRSAENAAQIEELVRSKFGNDFRIDYETLKTRSFLRRAASWVVSVLRASQTRTSVEILERSVWFLKDALLLILAEILRAQRAIFEKIDANDRRLSASDRRLSETIKMLADGGYPVSEGQKELNDILEKFYYRLEDRYRGSRELIKHRLGVYREYLRAAQAAIGGDPGGAVVDIGCGRGEMLELIREEGFWAVGVDTNATQLEFAVQHGFAAVHADALDYLKSLESESLVAVSGMHVIEHLAFAKAALMLTEVFRTLKTGGVVILETPNPHNIIVGSATFYIDPTHVRPLPPEVLQVLLESVGFTDVEVRPLHPAEIADKMVEEHKFPPHLAHLLYGPQDYGIIGHKRIQVR